jgi:hypothetical protein
MPKKLIYQLKITLKDTKPPIWRTIQIPLTYTFWELHCAIQDAFAWNHNHQHQFRFKDKITKTEIIFGIPTDEDILDGISTLPGGKDKVSKYLNPLYPKIEYIYDFYDNWEHVIKLEEVLPAEKDAVYPRCLKGKRNSPPDDCGGIWGYEEILDILSNHEFKEYEKTKEWVESMKGGPFAPEHFDPKEVEFEDPKKRFKECFSSDKVFKDKKYIPDMVVMYLKNMIEKQEHK